TSNAIPLRYDEGLQDQLKFLEYLNSTRGHYSSQLGQDVFALAMSGFKREGYFVEVGAHHGEYLSNTLMLERDHGWRGLLIEPDPTNYATLATRAGTLVKKAAWSRSGEMLRFKSVADSALSVVASVSPGDGHNRDSAREIVVETQTLDDILSAAGAPNIIDYISIDVEGAEVQVLDGLSLDRWNVQAMSIEHNHNTARIATFEKLLAKHGLVRAFDVVSDFDCYFVRPERLAAWRALVIS
ncbi:FkbM family methyltransferase, partial [Rhodoplanes sp. SY1]|uniref:FkbM family methyltransferase n=1 Tax=Rhodoplanes sp. SY1 TaxID=3166646 RepID=UPI0038B5FEFA